MQTSQVKSYYCHYLEHRLSGGSLKKQTMKYEIKRIELEKGLQERIA